MRKTIVMAAVCLFLISCTAVKRSSLGAEISRSPQMQTITEDELESLMDTDENYFTLYCGAKDITCQAIIQDTQKLKLHQASAYYFLDTETLMNASAKQEQAALDFIAFMERYSITKFPSVHYKQGAKIIKTHRIEDRDSSKVLTEAEEQARISGFRLWMNSVE